MLISFVYFLQNLPPDSLDEDPQTERTVGISLTGLTLPLLPSRDLDFHHHMSWSFSVQ
jgi:hypothetical protein